ncbi:senescence associated gene 20-like, partial [Musa acuminata AAA Group]|uniref:senescence associated gene 20-like n=1 Tax=Musa acuminata AAA Group TaxID=214697 RepID=UPI0031D951A6
ADPIRLTACHPRPELPASSLTAAETHRPPPKLANGSRVAESPEGTVRDLYEAINGRDVGRLHQLLAPDLEWWFHGQPEHQHLKRLLTGEAEYIAFEFEPQEVASFGSTVVAEGCSPGAVWVHAWTVDPEGVITQVREYFNTSLTVTRLGGDSALSSPASSSSSSSSSSSKDSAGSTQCLPVWESRLHQRARKSLPGLVLAI